MAQHDIRDYDRVKHTLTANAFARLRDNNAEQQRRSDDQFVGGLAALLRVAFTSNPDAYGHIPADDAAALLLARWPR